MTSQKPVIVCDIDEVLFPFVKGLIAHHNKQRGTELVEDDFFSYHFQEVWGGTQAETDEIVEGFMESDCLHLLPVEHAKGALDTLKTDFDVVLVTARNGLFAENTTMWLRSHLPELFHDVMFAGNTFDGREYRTKGEICAELGALLIVDDHPDNIRSAAAVGVDGILFGERPWTLEAVDAIPDNVVHHKNWKQVLDYIYGDWRHKRLS